MRSEGKEHRCTNEPVAELFHLQIEGAEMCQFVAKGDGIHHFFSELEGYVGMDILFLSEEKVILLIRWSNYKLFDRNLPSILNACPITDWLKDAVNISHQPAILKSYSNRNKN